MPIKTKYEDEPWTSPQSKDDDSLLIDSGTVSDETEEST